MPVPFGFSVGDFLTVINAFKEIGLALREHGGACDDYQCSVHQLETVSAIVDRLEVFTSTTSDLSEVNAIRGQAQKLQNEVEDFLTKVQKYKVKLGQQCNQGFHRGAWIKIKWAQFVAAEVFELQRSIALQLQNIQILLHLHHARATSQIYSSQEAGQQDTNSRLQAIENHMTALSLRTASPQQVDARIRLTLTIPLLDIPRHDMIALFEKLRTEVVVVFNLLIAITLVKFFNLILAIPHAVLFYRVLRQVPQAVSLLMQDNVRFEDALGRFASLSFNDFRHWKLFETRIHCKFEDSIGINKIKQGQFTLTCPKLPGVFLDESNWQQIMEPGFQVVMALDINNIQVRGTSCPRCFAKCKTTSSLMKRCSSCLLVFSTNLDKKTYEWVRRRRLARLLEAKLHRRQIAAKAEDVELLNPDSQPETTESASEDEDSEPEEGYESFDTSHRDNQEMACLGVFKRVNLSIDNGTSGHVDVGVDFGYPLTLVRANEW